MAFDPFPSPKHMTLQQIAFMTVMYGYVLLQASNLISDGSELLLLVPSLAPLVGSVVLPVLGAVPDGMMVLVSGLGPDAQNQITVGVGALAGSTVMLLTLPWFLAVLAGRVSIVDGDLNYRRRAGAGEGWEKLMPEHQGMIGGLFNSGVACGPEIKRSARMMLFTLLGYVIIQGAAFAVDAPGSKPADSSPAETEASLHSEADYENVFALVGLVICVLEFAYYLVDQSRATGTEEGRVDNMIAEKTVAGIRDGKMTLRGAMARFRDSGWAQGCKDGKEGDLEQALVNKDSLKEVKRMCMILMPFFQIYDENGDNQIDFEEFRLIFRDVNENLSKDVQQQLFAAADADESGYISFEEFVACVMSFALDASNDIKETGGGRKVKEVAAPPKFQEDESKQGDHDEEGEEAEDIPEDLADLTVEEQQSRIKKRSLYMMSLGTVLVIAFSDPMVDLLGEIGERVGIPAFYISFLLAPLASNSSELVAAYNYAQKRTAKSIVTSLAQLEGAAIMNNTFCLGIFLALVYFKGLAWEFSAETISIASVQLMLGVMVLLKKKQRLVDAFIVLSFYPVSLGIVWLLENKFGWD